MEVKTSGYKALFESLTRTLQVPMDVAKGGTKAGGGILGGIFNTMNNFGNLAAKQTSRVVNTGNWMFEKFPVIASVSALVIFWKPLKNTFNKLTGRKDPEITAMRNQIQTLRDSNPYMSNEAGPVNGRGGKYWQNYVASTRGMPPTPGQDGF